MQFLGFGLPDFGDITGLPVIDPNPVPVPVAPPQQVEPAPVKPPRAEPIKVPIKQPPLPLPGESGPIIADPGVPPVPMPPVEPQIPMPAPAPVPQPAPVPIPEPPMPAPVPQVPAPVPMPAPVPIPEPVMPPPPPVRVDPPLPPAPPVNELPPPVQVPPPINLPAPPEDIVSRGTVGPVAPPPVEVPPPVMQPTPEPVAPPIPLAPSQPGVPTPMAPGSFEGVLPAPAPPPPVEVPPPMMQPAPEPVAPPVELPPMMAVDPEPGVLPTFGRVDDPRLAQVQPPMDEPTGIETMAPAVGFGDYLGGEVAEAMPAQPAPQPAQEDTISLPDGSSFDLSTLDLTGLPGEGFDFEMPTPAGPTPEPTPEPEPTLPPGTGLTLDDLVSLGQDAGGFVEPETGVYTPGQQPAGLPQSAIDEAQGTSPSDFMGSFNPEDYVTPAGEFLTDGQLAEYGDLEPGTPIPTNTTNTSLTPEQQAALDEYLASNPGGINVDLLGFNPFGQMSGMGSFGSIPSGTVPDGQGGYSVIPVGPVGDLNNTGGQAPAPGRVDVRSASSYGLTGAQQTMPVSANPFRRPETQGGIGSLAGGG